MFTLTLFHDARDATAVDFAEALARRTPPDVRVDVAPSASSPLPGAMGDVALVAPSASPPLPSALGDVALVAPGVDTPDLIRRLRDSGFAGPVAVVWPHSWPRELERFHAVYPEADAVVMNDPVYWDRLGRLPRTLLLPHAVDLECFAEAAPATERPAGVLLARDPDRMGGSGPDHLLDEEARWTFGGLGIPVAAPGDVSRRADLRAWLEGGSVVVAWDDDLDSRRIVLAAAACGCAVVCTPRASIPGLIEDGVTGCVAVPEPEDLRAAVEKALRHRADLAGRLRERVADWSWSGRADAYFALLRDLFGRHAHEAGPRDAATIDLTNEVTVFVTTIGAPSYAACRVHLAAQDCRFSLEVIDHVAPMSAAFQRMLDHCTTPYYVQVDEDMLLYPHAIRTLHEQIRAAPEEVALVVGYLLDAHLGALIQGVKIFRHAVAARYPYEDTGSFELTQIERMRPDGFTYAVVPLEADWSASTVAGGVLGLHGTHWTPLGIFERYATLERARHEFPKNQRWLRPWSARFLERVLHSGSELDLYALMGIVAGRIRAGDGAKDFRRYEGLAGFDGICAFLDELRGTDR